MCWLKWLLSFILSFTKIWMWLFIHLISFFHFLLLVKITFKFLEVLTGSIFFFFYLFLLETLLKNLYFFIIIIIFSFRLYFFKFLQLFLFLLFLLFLIIRLFLQGPFFLFWISNFFMFSFNCWLTPLTFLLIFSLLYMYSLVISLSLSPLLFLGTLADITTVAVSVLTFLLIFKKLVFKCFLERQLQLFFDFFLFLLFLFLPL